MPQESNEYTRAAKEYKNERNGGNLLLKELLSNSFHAILMDEGLTEGNISLCIKTIPQDLDGTDNLEKVTITIKDNGCGIHLKEDKNYVTILDEPNLKKISKKLPSKGQGRLAIVYFTEGATISTVYKENNQFLEYSFLYPPQDQKELFGLPEFACLSTKTTTGTTIDFTIHKDQTKLKKIKSFLNSDWQTWIEKTFFPYFMQYNCIMNIDYNRAVVKISSEEIKQGWEQEEFRGDKSKKDFIFYIKPTFQNDKGINIYFYAENLVIEKSVYKLDWDIPSHDILVGCDFFTERINTIGTSIKLYDDEKEDIKTDIEEFCKSYFVNDLKQINTDNELNYKKTITKFPYLSGYQIEDKNYLFKNFSEDKIYEITSKEMLLDNRKILQKKHLSDKDYEKIEELAARDLMQYILLREKIIDEIVETPPSTREERLHNLIVPKNSILKKESTNITASKLWLFDERFMDFTEVYSDKQIQEILKGNKSAYDKKRPDLCIFLNRDQNNKPADIIIIELKNRKADADSFSNIDSQLKNRATSIIQKEGFTDLRRLFFFGIIEIDSIVKDAIILEDYFELHSHEEFYYKYLTLSIPKDGKILCKIPAVFNILSWSAVIKDARLRNKTFINLLKESIDKHSSDIMNSLN